MDKNIIVFDIEANSLYFDSTKIWTIHALHRGTGEVMQVSPYKDEGAKKKLMDFFFQEEYPTIVGHNILGYDMFVLRKLLDIDFQVGKHGSDTIEGERCLFLDTYCMSMYLWPDRNDKGKKGHSLKWWGDVLGYKKMDYRGELIELGKLDKDSPKGEEFSFYHPLMEEYCKRDVIVTDRVLDALLKEYHVMYGEDFDFPTHFRCVQKSFYLMNIQELSGWPFDVDKAKALVIEINKRMREIEDVVEPQLPPRSLKKAEKAFYTMPAKPYKKDGELSATMLKWIDKHNATLINNFKLEAYGKEYDIIPNNMLDISLPMKLANQQQIKEWLLSEGWVPTFWNTKVNAEGKKENTSPKLQEMGVICPNLLKMEKGIIKDITTWMSLRNRLGVVEGWLSHPRLAYDGRLPGGSSGLTSSHRQMHRCIVNVPATTSLLGSEMRELFTVEDGYKIAAADASGLELRMQAHYTYRYDNGKTAEILLNGDAHSLNAKKMFPKETAAFDIDSPDFDKDDLGFKPWRSKAKGISYAVLYGAGAAKIGKMVGVSTKGGEELLEKFWQANPGTRAFKDAAERWFELAGGGKYILALDGRLLHVRAKYSIINLLFQSAGAIVMDYSCCIIDAWLGKIHWDEKGRPFYLYKGKKVWRTAYVHDEMEFLCEEGIEEEVKDMIVKAIVKAGEMLRLKVHLDGDGSVGSNWKDVH